MNASQLLVKCLENEGVEYIFGVPGEENVLFLDALKKSSSIRYINAADERGAAFMAAAYGRFTGKPAVVATTIGPGALNIPNGLAFASLAGIPLVAITWQTGLRINGKDGGYQYVDVVSVLKPVVKWQRVVSSPAQMTSVVREAFRVAQSPKCGPAHIELPEDVAADEVEGNTEPLQVVRNKKSIPDAKVLTRAADSLLNAIRPIVIAGFRTSDDVVSRALRSFVESTGIFVISTPMAQGVLPSSDPHSLFSFSSHQRGRLHQAIDRADTILTIGYSSLEYSPRLWNPQANKDIINIDTFPAKTHSHFDPKIELIGDITTTLGVLEKKLQKRGKWNFNPLRQAREELTNGEMSDASFPVKPQRLVRALRKVANNAIIVHDNGMHKLWMTRFFHPDKPNQVLVDNALGSMGSGIPQAIVAKLANPDKKVLANVGDGGLLMSLGEIATAISLKLPIVILVWRDDGYGMIRWHQEKKGLVPFGVSLTNPNYAELAESFGGVGFEVTKTSQLESTIKQALGGNKLSIIDCPVDYSENIKVFKGRQV